jgi:ubiquitin C-terminal hydrolase
VWNREHIEKDCRPIVFPLILDMTQYSFDPFIHYLYQLAAVISHIDDPQEEIGHYITFLYIFDKWIRFNDTNVRGVEERQALQENFPESPGSDQTASILLYVQKN